MNPKAVQNLTAVAGSHAHRVLIQMFGGKVDAMLEESQKLLEAAEHSGDLIYTYMGLVFRAWAETRNGKHTAALESIGQAEVIKETFSGRILLADWAEAVRAEISLNQADYQQALELSTGLISQTKTSKSIYAEGLAQRIRALALANLPEPNRAEIRGALEASVEAFEKGQASVEIALTRQLFEQEQFKPISVVIGRAL